MDFELDALQQEHTEKSQVDDATRRTAIPVGTYTGSLEVKNQVYSKLRQDGGGFEGRPEIWFKVIMKDQSDKQYTTTAFTSFRDWRWDWDSGAGFKPGEPGYNQVRQDSKSKQWGQLVKVVDKDCEMTVAEQVEAIQQTPFRIGIKGKFEKDGETAWAYNTTKAEELLARGYVQVSDEISFFGEVE